MKGNNTIKRIIKALSKLQYQIINGKRLDVFMKNIIFSGYLIMVMKVITTQELNILTIQLVLLSTQENIK